MFKIVSAKIDFSNLEKKILLHWETSRLVKKYLKRNDKNPPPRKFSFLDGPITANNPMGVHHAWGRTYKDLWQRFFNMLGYRQRFQNGFDEQGLWVEVEVEKELGFRNKKDIERFGIDKFVNLCKERVKKFAQIQTEQSRRLAYFMDWENSYHTSSDENNYAIWNFLKVCHQKGYLYKGRDSVPWCPRCGTAISQHEILTEEYQEITHKAIYVKYKIKNSDETLLVWTTTPWTLPSNVAIAVNTKLIYGVWDLNGTSLIFAVARMKALGVNQKPKKTFKGKELVGRKYEGVFDQLPALKGIKHLIVGSEDLVTTEEGTGLVHIAPGAGEEDFDLAQKENLATVASIDDAANYIDGFGDLTGKNAKENPDLFINKLKEKGVLFKVENYTHRYPTCWRCKTELVWRVVDEWYISMKKLRKPLVELTKKINWIPSFGKERELDWLKNMHDWLISKKRYWGLALPIFECQKCGNFEVMGSKEELKKRAIEGWEDFDGNSPHRPWVDSIKIKCKKCKKLVSRIKDVGNPWLDAGIVPFSTMKYFSSKPYWKKWFPIQVVAESFPGQFKNWFYSLLVMSAVLEDAEPVKNIFGYASVLDEKGEEMHKSKGNAIVFDEAVEKIGADPMRWLYQRHNPAENLNFGYAAAEEIKRKLLTLYNVYTFFGTYVKLKDFPKDQEINPVNILDKWIVSKMDHLIGTVEFALEKYDIAKAVLNIEDFFINDLSLWYVRRSRKRFHEESTKRQVAIETFYYVLINTAKIIAPIMPFFAEAMYQQLKVKGMAESVHLQPWPKKEDQGQTDLDLEQKMDEVRNIVTLALAQRALNVVKVRQPLASLKIKSQKSKIKGAVDLLLIKIKKI